MAQRFEYSNDPEMTAQKADILNDFLWTAFDQNINGNCVIEKQAFNFPTQTYFSFERSVTKVNQITLDATNVYVSYIDDIVLGEIFSKNNPLTTFTSIPRNTILESPVDVKINGTDLWYLLPGNLSGTNAQLLRYDTTGALQQTVDLSKSGEIVNGAKSMTIDSFGDIWMGTYETPARVIRVFAISGGLYDFTIHNNLTI